MVAQRKNSAFRSSKNEFVTTQNKIKIDLLSAVESFETQLEAIEHLKGLFLMPSSAIGASEGRETDYFIL